MQEYDTLRISQSGIMVAVASFRRTFDPLTAIMEVVMSEPAKKNAYVAMSTEALLAAHAAKPTSGSLNHALSQKLAAANKHGEALKHAILAAEYGAPRAAHYSSLAKQLIATKAYRMAELTLHDALNKGLKTPSIYLLLGQALGKQKQWDSAIQCVDYAISLAPSKPIYEKVKQQLLSRKAGVPKAPA
jgi:tetratricopeptide (TPR) repeat protein